MKVKDVMTRNVEVARPDETIQAVAQRMAKGDYGFAPVCDGRKLLGTVTDRDLTIRALAGGLPPSTSVAEVMTREVSWAHEDDDLTEVLDKMGAEQIRRLPVVDEQRDLVGVVSIGDLAREAKDKHAGEALEDISKPHGSSAFG
jgi:CBS domain-containing protein